MKNEGLIISIVFTAVVLGLVILLKMVARALSVWGSNFTLPFKKIFYPVKNQISKSFHKLNFFIEGKFYSAILREKFGSLLLVLFLILASGFIVIKGIVGIATMGLGPFAEQLMLSTTIGALSEMVAFDGLGRVYFVKVVVIAIATDFFMDKCKHLSLPIQILYDVIFLLFLAMFADMVSFDFVETMPEKWWNALQFEVFTDVNLMKTDNLFKEFVLAVWTVWGGMLNLLLKGVLFGLGIAIIVKAMTDILSSVLCALVSVGIFESVSIALSNMGIEFQLPEFLTLILMILWIVFTELFLLNVDDWLGLGGDEAEIIDSYNYADDSCPYGWFSVFLGGYLGSPLFYLAILVIIAEGSELLSVIIMLILVFLLTCVPGLWKIWSKNQDIGDSIEHTVKFLGKTLIYIPMIAIAIIELIVGLVMGIFGRTVRGNVTAAVMSMFFMIQRI